MMRESMYADYCNREPKSNIEWDFYSLINK